MSSSMTGYSSQYGTKTPKGYSQYSLPTMNPQQQQYYGEQFGAVQPGVMDAISQLRKMAGGDESYYNQLEAPAYRNFAQGIGQLGSRFAGMGMGATGSSGFKNAGAGMATDLSTSLQSQRMNLQQQAMQELLGLSGQLMGRQTHEYGLARKAPSLWESLLPALMQGLGQAGGTAAMSFI